MYILLLPPPPPLLLLLHLLPLLQYLHHLHTAFNISLYSDTFPEKDPAYVKKSERTKELRVRGKMRKNLTEPLVRLGAEAITEKAICYKV